MLSIKLQKTGALFRFTPMFLDITDTMTVGCFAPDMWCGLFEIPLHSNLTTVQPPRHTHTPTPQWPHLKHPTVLRVNECTQPSLWKEIKAAAVSTPRYMCRMCGKTRAQRCNSCLSHHQIFSALKCNKCSRNFLRASQSPNSFPHNEVILKRAAEHACIMRCRNWWPL